MKLLIALLISLLSITITSGQNDTYYANGAQWYLNQINVETAWNMTRGDQNVIVAVVDTGIDASHPELVGQVLAGYDFVNDDNDASDDNGHGTAVAGCIAPKANNGQGVAGIASNVKLLPVKVLNANKLGNIVDIAAGIKYAADQGADIINISVSTTSKSPTLRSAVEYAWNKGCVLIASVGNRGVAQKRYPAAFDNVVAVSASTYSGSLASFSSYGDHVDLCAPGAGILTLSNNGSYKSASGTSYSAPIVSGVAALIASLPMNLSNTQIVDALLSSATDMGVNGYDEQFGYGRVDAGNALFASLTGSASTGALATTASIESTVSISEFTANGAIVKVQVAQGASFSVECSSDLNGWTTLLSGVGAGSVENFSVSNFSSNCGFIRVTTK